MTLESVIAVLGFAVLMCEKIHPIVKRFVTHAKKKNSAPDVQQNGETDSELLYVERKLQDLCNKLNVGLQQLPSYNHSAASQEYRNTLEVQGELSTYVREAQQVLTTTTGTSEDKVKKIVALVHKIAESGDKLIKQANWEFAKLMDLSQSNGYTPDGVGAGRVLNIHLHFHITTSRFQSNIDDHPYILKLIGPEVIAAINQLDCGTPITNPNVRRRLQLTCEPKVDRCRVGADEDGEKRIRSDALMIMKRELDLTKEGYNAELLEVANEKNSVVLRCRKKQNEMCTEVGAIRGRSMLQMAEEDVSSRDRCGGGGGEKKIWTKQKQPPPPPYYEIEVEVLRVVMAASPTTTTKDEAPGVAKGFGMGIVSWEQFRKDSMPGSYSRPDAGLCYDSRVERGQVRRARCPLGSAWGGPMEVGWVREGDKVGMVFDGVKGELRFTRNGKQVAAAVVDLKKKKKKTNKGCIVEGKGEGGMSAVLAMASDCNCQLRILKFGHSWGGGG